MTFQFKCPSGCLLEGEETQAGSTIQCPLCSQWFVIPAPIAAPTQPHPQQPLPQQPYAQPNPAQPDPAQPNPAQLLPQQLQPGPQAPYAQPQQPTLQQPAPHVQPQPGQPQPGHPQPGHPQVAQPQIPQPQIPQPQSPQPSQPQAAQQPAAPAESHAAESKPSFESSPAARLLGEDYRTLHFPCPSGHLVEAPRELAGQQATCPHCAQQFMLLETESDEYKKKLEMVRRRREARIGNAWLNWAIAVAIFVLCGLAFLIIKSQLDK